MRKTSYLHEILSRLASVGFIECRDMERIGVCFEGFTKCLSSTAHLYNASVQVKSCQFNWPEMDRMIEIQKAVIFTGNCRIQRRSSILVGDYNKASAPIQLRELQKRKPETTCWMGYRTSVQNHKAVKHIFEIPWKENHIGAHPGWRLEHLDSTWKT